MRRLPIVCVSSLVALVAAAPVGRADELGFQPSMSIALGKTEGELFGHLWGGFGVHVRGGAADGGFVLVGVEGDIHGSEEPPETARMSSGGSRESASEAWAVVRTGAGWFGEGIVPRASLYLLGGARMVGPDGAPSMRFGAGLSAPAAMPVLAYLGIPTMVEFGLDVGRGEERTRGFARLGWNF